MHKKSTENMVTSQPKDWAKAFRVRAKAMNMSLSEWVGQAAKARLPRNQRELLSERRGQGPHREE